MFSKHNRTRNGEMKVLPIGHKSLPSFGENADQHQVNNLIKEIPSTIISYIHNQTKDGQTIIHPPI